jgi:hypothetical protein
LDVSWAGAARNGAIAGSINSSARATERLRWPQRNGSHVIESFSSRGNALIHAPVGRAIVRPGSTTPPNTAKEYHNRKRG